MVCGGFRSLLGSVGFGVGIVLFGFVCSCRGFLGGFCGCLGLVGL